MKELLTIGDKGMFASLAVWGLLGLSILAIVLTIVSALTGEPNREFSGFQFD